METVAESYGGRRVVGEHHRHSVGKEDVSLELCVSRVIFVKVDELLSGGSIDGLF